MAEEKKKKLFCNDILVRYEELKLYFELCLYSRKEK